MGNCCSLSDPNLDNVIIKSDRTAEKLITTGKNLTTQALNIETQEIPTPLLGESNKLEFEPTIDSKSFKFI